MDRLDTNGKIQEARLVACNGSCLDGEKKIMRKNGQWTEWTEWKQIQNYIMRKNGQQTEWKEWTDWTQIQKSQEASQLPASVPALMVKKIMRKKGQQTEWTEWTQIQSKIMRKNRQWT